MKIKDLFREVKYPIKLYDSNGKQVYHENSEGKWYKWEHDADGNEIYVENSNGYIRDRRPAKELTVEQICKELGYNVKVVRR